MFIGYGVTGCPLFSMNSFAFIAFGSVTVSDWLVLQVYYNSIITPLEGSAGRQLSVSHKH